MERFIVVEVVTSPELVLIVGCIGLVLNIIGAIVVHGKRQPVDGWELTYRFIQTTAKAQKSRSPPMYWSWGLSVPRAISLWVLGIPECMCTF